MRFLIVLLLLGGSAVAAPYKPPANVAAALQTFRAAAGKPWGPPQEPATVAAHLIFKTVPLVGMTTGEVRALLGAPDDTLGKPGATSWHYIRHDGEMGASYRLSIRRGRMVKVERLATQ